MKASVICIISVGLCLLPASAQMRRPILNYSTLLGGDGEERAVDVVVDSTGSAYVTGTTSPARVSSADVFVAKVNPAGTALVYYRSIGGSGDDSAVGIALGSAGQVYVAGTTTSNDFPTTPGAYRRAAGTSGRDAFVIKFSADGTVVYSTYLGPAIAGGVAVDSTGSAYISGWTYDPAFPLTPGALQRTIKGGQDAFMAGSVPTGARWFTRRCWDLTATRRPVALRWIPPEMPMLQAARTERTFPSRRERSSETRSAPVRTLSFRS
jgi:hypothetical protein